jgi:ankyrin repeat protein
MKRVIFLLSSCMITSPSHSMQLKREFNFKAFFEKVDSTGKTYLHHAIKGGNAEKWQSGDLNDEAPNNEYLHNILTTNPQLISCIIKAGVNVNIFDKKRRTPLFYAAKYQNEAALKLLLTAGADPNIRNREGIPPLVIACSIENNAAIITMLLKGGALFSDLFERVPPHLASAFESESKRETILESALKTCPVNALALLKYNNGDIFHSQSEEESSEWSSFSDEESPVLPALRSSQNVVGIAPHNSRITGNKKESSFGTPSYSFIEKLSYALY